MTKGTAGLKNKQASKQNKKISMGFRSLCDDHDNEAGTNRSLQDCDWRQIVSFKQLKVVRGAPLPVADTFIWSPSPSSGLLLCFRMPTHPP